jgi:hypothetical protein
MGCDTNVTFVQCPWIGPDLQALSGFRTLRHDRNTNSRNLAGKSELGSGDCGVQLRSHLLGVVAALVAAAALSGCSDVDTGQAWFVKPFDIAGRGAGYSFSELAETKKKQRPITANDLVNADGSCPAAPVAAAPPPAPVATASPAPGAPPGPPVGALPPSPDGTAADPLLGSGIALGMSECEVVYRAGAPSSVQIGSLPNGDRTAALTFPSGPRPGVYRFIRGALTEMDAVAAPPAPPQVVKKKPAKPKKAAQN